MKCAACENKIVLVLYSLLFRVVVGLWVRVTVDAHLIEGPTLLECLSLFACSLQMCGQCMEAVTAWLSLEPGKYHSQVTPHRLCWVVARFGSVQQMELSICTLEAWRCPHKHFSNLLYGYSGVKYN